MSLKDQITEDMKTAMRAKDAGKLAAAVKRHYKRIRSQQLPKKLY